MSPLTLSFGNPTAESFAAWQNRATCQPKAVKTRETKKAEEGVMPAFQKAPKSFHLHHTRRNC
jgi:hypothetical protein